MPFLDGAAGRVYYRHWTTENARATVVFLHGFGEHSGLYHRYAAELGQHGIEVWALDEVGHGLTEGERGRFESFDHLVTNARRLTALARAEADGRPIVVAGHSLGSLVALSAALDEPLAYDGVVVSGAPLSPLPWLLEADGEEGELDLDPATLSSDPFYLDALENDTLAFTSADVVSVLAEAFPPVWRRLESELPGLDLPLLAVHGGDDQVAPLDGVTAWSSRLPGLEVHVVEDAGHDVLNEVQHGEVADRVAEFVLAHAGAHLPSGAAR